MTSEIDVHLKTWNVSILTSSGFLDRYSQPASAIKFMEHLANHYPQANYNVVYESGFSGFSIYYTLQELGINCKVVHAADVPTSQWENLMKSDPVDSVKLAKALKAGLITGIYIPDKNTLDVRRLVRSRKAIVKSLSEYKSRIKHLLYNHGIEYPKELATKGSHWTKRFIAWLENDVILLSDTRESLNVLVDMVKVYRIELLKVTRKLRAMLSAMTLLTEIDDINRFKNQRQFASYLGLIPTCHNSGEKESNGVKTFRGNKHIGPMIVESAWSAIRYDRAMAAYYGYYCKKMKPNQAIIRIARKLSNRIIAVLKIDIIYCHDKN
jgi:transposase